MMTLKLSIAIFLLRIAVRPLYIWILRSSIVVVAIWSFVIFMYDIFQCLPVQAQWDFTIEHPKCVTGTSFVAAAYSISVMTIVTDWLYALLPIPMLWSVQMTTQAKVTVAFILSLGIFASIATLIRLRYLIELTDRSDVLYAATPATIWTIVEPGLGITAASLITIRPLLKSFNLHGFQHPSSNYNSSSHARTQRQSLNLNPYHSHSETWTWTNSTVSSPGLKEGGRWWIGGKGLGLGLGLGEGNGSGKVVVRERVLESDVGVVLGGGERDGGSEECILEGKGGGIRRTVDFVVERERESNGGLESV
ncbi:hypothetical protein ONS95_001956 [Cadophora gregata]|uniref:uncharacterized protein n=1 Tax=Cadophora gregata TaxID=51156 RepID=UPI0026DAECF4|nr:uncharacterized protein ONS95_001956 [Cadophora gregata]KAK0111610.1 hypothetical protein ONS95_001956 [Cadophora gregata]